MKFDLKNGKTYFESVISPSFDELHCSTIVHMNHMKRLFQNLSFYCTKKVPKNRNNFFYFRHGVGTHFLVLVQTLIYLTLNFVFIYVTFCPQIKQIKIIGALFPPVTAVVRALIIICIGMNVFKKYYVSFFSAWSLFL